MAGKQEDIIKVENGRLIIDVAATGTQMSASGKNKVLFSTHGNVKLPGDLTLGVNLYTKA